MIDLYYWPTPNGWKISIALEELGIPYKTHFVNIGRGEQREPEFLAISPNGRIPAIVDSEPSSGGQPVSLFESGAILIYLADKTGKLLPPSGPERYRVLEWLMWQMGGLGPMLGQTHHFRQYAPEPVPYAIERYTNEAHRLYGVLERRLEGREYLCDTLSIADLACWPWVVPYKLQGQDLDEFPSVRRWHERMKQLPSVQRGMELGAELRKPMDESAKKVLFGQR